MYVRSTECTLLRGQVSPGAVKQAPMCPSKTLGPEDAAVTSCPVIHELTIDGLQLVCVSLAPEWTDAWCCLQWSSQWPPSKRAWWAVSGSSPSLRRAPCKRKERL